MSDLIDREDAISEILDVYEREFPTASGAFDEFAVSIVPNILRNLPSVEPEQKWVPVTERLPEDREDVLVCGVEAISNEYVYGVKRLDVDTWRPIIAPSIRWIAWMPLPEPFGLYEEENK